MCEVKYSEISEYIKHIKLYLKSAGYDCLVSYRASYGKTLYLNSGDAHQRDQDSSLIYKIEIIEFE